MVGILGSFGLLVVRYDKTRSIFKFHGMFDFDVNNDFLEQAVGSTGLDFNSLLRANWAAVPHSIPVIALAFVYQVRHTHIQSMS